MKSHFGIRLWILITAIVLVAGGTIYGLSTAWRRMHLLETKLNSSHIASFRIAGEVQHGLLNLNNAMLRYVLVRDPRQWQEFDLASTDFDHWTDAHDPSLNPDSPLTTDAERKVFTALNRAFDAYLSSARAVQSNAQPAMVSSAQLAQLSAFDTQTHRMQEIAQHLADAHQKAEVAFLATANASLAHLRNTLIGGVVLLLALVAAMSWGIYRDLIAPLRTKLVRSQNLLERQEKLATLGTLAAGIAHEIRNPLTSIKARLYMVEKHLQIVPAARKDTEIINSEISRLERVVQDVLSFARPADPLFGGVDSSTLLHEVQGLMSPSLESSGIRLVVDAPAGLNISADGGHLKQVLINLVKNGAEAIVGTGVVTLRARASRATISAREIDTVTLEVSDTGNGIAPETEKRLFDPFFSTKETGTGLGLSIASRIVEQHGGLLKYQTRAGHGSTFSIVLPLKIAHVDEGESKTTRPDAGRDAAND